MTLLWRVTLIVAGVLLLITIFMAARVLTASSAEFTGYITERGTTVYLRSRPTESGRAIAILDPGTEVQVARSRASEGITWYYITTESGSGWIPEAYLRLSRP